MVYKQSMTLCDFGTAELNIYIYIKIETKHIDGVSINQHQVKLPRVGGEIVENVKGKQRLTPPSNERVTQSEEKRLSKK